MGWTITAAAGLVALAVGVAFPLQVKWQAPEATMGEIYTVLWDCLADVSIKPNVGSSYRKITTSELCKQLEEKSPGEKYPPVVVVDTRTEQDFRDGHIPGAIFIPFNTFRDEFRTLPRNKPIVLACQFGHYSVVAANMMLREGYKTVYDYSEGMEKWVKQGKPQINGLPVGYESRLPPPKQSKTTGLLEDYKSPLLEGNSRTTKIIYMDYNATTPIDPRVLEIMMPYLTMKFGNAASRTHSLGGEAENAVYKARQQVASVIHAASPKEIVFTSGASESNNLAIKGLAYAMRRLKGRNHIITCVTEHKAVLDTCEALEEDGFEVTYLKVGADGLINLEELASSIQKSTLLVSIMLANNEIGVIQPFREIGHLCHENDIFFHSDGTQGVGKIALDVQRDHVDLLSISAHKIYGPKGVGALYVRSSIDLVAQIHGGGHEHGMRSGTLNVPGIVGLGECCRIAEMERVEENKRIGALRDNLLDKLTSSIPNHKMNGSMTSRLTGNIHISFAGVTSEEILMELTDVAISSGSACNSRKTGPSHVVQALGIGPDMIGCTLRLGIGRFTTQAEVDFVASRLSSVVRMARKQKIASV